MNLTPLKNTIPSRGKFGKLAFKTHKRAQALFLQINSLQNLQASWKEGGQISSDPLWCLRQEGSWLSRECLQGFQHLFRLLCLKLGRFPQGRSSGLHRVIWVGKNTLSDQESLAGGGICSCHSTWADFLGPCKICQHHSLFWSTHPWDSCSFNPGTRHWT